MPSWLSLPFLLSLTPRITHTLGVKKQPILRDEPQPNPMVLPQGWTWQVWPAPECSLNTSPRPLAQPLPLWLSSQMLNSPPYPQASKVEGRDEHSWNPEQAVLPDILRKCWILRKFSFLSSWMGFSLITSAWEQNPQNVPGFRKILWGATSLGDSTGDTEHPHWPHHHRHMSLHGSFPPSLVTIDI